MTLLNRVPDLAFVEQHPKRSFVRRAIELEVRLSYHDRILKTLPEPMQTDPNVIATQSPGPSFEYEDPGKFTQLTPIVALSSLTIHSESLL